MQVLMMRMTPHSCVEEYPTLQIKYFTRIQYGLQGKLYQMKMSGFELTP
jgi:hypothetical protein